MRSYSTCIPGTTLQVFVEPDDGEQVITNAMQSAQKSIWLEIYI
jgi:hypothetical protein